MMELMMKIAINVLMCALLLTAGYLSNDVYRYYTYQRDFNGLYMQNYNESHAKDTARRYDKMGDWVCVNVRGMSFQEALSTCGHETGHEIFAEVCGTNFTKCLEVTNETKHIIGNMCQTSKAFKRKQPIKVGHKMTKNKEIKGK